MKSNVPHIMRFMKTSRWDRWQHFKLACYQLELYVCIIVVAHRGGEIAQSLASLSTTRVIQVRARLDQLVLGGILSLCY